MTLAFRGRAQTRSFGGPTYGVPSTVQLCELEDGALLGDTPLAVHD